MIGLTLDVFGILAFVSSNLFLPMASQIFLDHTEIARVKVSGRHKVLKVDDLYFPHY